MPFRTDLAVEAIENADITADVRHVRQSRRTLDGVAVSGVDILSGEAEGILENVFWVPPAEEENV